MLVLTHNPFLLYVRFTAALDLIPFQLQFRDHNEYSDPSTEAYARLQEFNDEMNQKIWDPQYVMIGDYLELLNATFARKFSHAKKTDGYDDTFFCSFLVPCNCKPESADAGKPWQIWIANTMVGHQTIVTPEWFLPEVPEEDRDLVARYVNFLRATPADNFLRIMDALGSLNQTSNRDGFGGTQAELARILEIARDVANNMVILGGDVHAAYAFSVYDNNTFQEGVPVTVNLISSALTSASIGAAYDTIFSPIAPFIDVDALHAAMGEGNVNQVPGMRYSNIFKKGFFAVKVTPEKHVAEYFLFTEETMQTDYESAREESGGITASVDCVASLETRAGEKGSLDRSDECSAIEFDSARPSFWNLPVPIRDYPNYKPLINCDFRGCVYDEPTEGELCPASDICNTFISGVTRYRMFQEYGDGDTYVCLSICIFESNVQERKAEGYQCGDCPADI